MPKKNHHNSSGFSMVEVAIVIVVIALLLALISQTKSIIQASKLRALATQFQEYEVAFRTFVGTYNAMPGDMSNATSYWGACDTADMDSGTANGDGDQTIENGSGTGVNCTSNEGLRAWQHLYLSGITHTETVPYTITAWIMTSSNFPSATIREGAAFWFFYNASVGGQKVILGKVRNDGTNGPAQYAILLPKEAYELDKKMDDGVPSSSVGRAFGANATVASGYSLGSCVSGNSYINLSDTTNTRCVFHLILSRDF